MRSIVIAAVMAAGIGLVGIGASAAAPANGVAIYDAAHLNPAVDQVRWHWRHHWHYHWHWRHHRHHRWWR
jgi:hypothetical protein